MIRTTPILLLTLAASVAATSFALADNPVVQTNFTADPAPLVHNGAVYLYTGHDEDDAFGFKMLDWRCYTSTDMVNWTDHGVVMSLKTFPWATQTNGAWASHAIERDGRFYFYATVSVPGTRREAIAVAVADNPLGPFEDALGRPLIDGGKGYIDPAAFVDDDGQAYLYWGNPKLWYVKLNKDMISYSGDIVESVPTPANYQEGPWMYKRQGRYYMAYASTCCPEGLGYAMSDRPTGPWEFKGYIMKPHPKSSGNHPGIIDYKGRSYVFGFNFRLNFALTNQHRERRSVCVTELDFRSDGTIAERPWWDNVGAQQIGALNPYTRVEAETICWSEGIKSEPSSQGGMNVYPTRDDAFIKVKGVDFGAEGAASFTASVAGRPKQGLKGGAIELRLDRVDGALIGTLPVADTGGQWKSETIPVVGATGTHDLFLVFRDAPITPIFKLDHWQFGKRAAATKDRTHATAAGTTAPDESRELGPQRQ